VRFYFGAIPEESDFTKTDDGWVPLTEPPPHVAMYWVAIPLALMLGVAFALLWNPVVDWSANLCPPWSALTAVLVFVVIVPIHEGLHMLAHPGNGRSSRTILGCWPRMLTLYVHYQGELRRDRFLVIYALPFLILSLVPVLTAYAFGTATVPLAMFSTINAMTASVDLVGFALLAWQVPRRAVVRNHGWKTYWRLT
jgi:hypothetical protein